MNKVESEEERKKKQILADKICAMVEEFIKLRHNLEGAELKVKDPLEFTTVFTQMCPDLPTIYNYRREIILKKFNN